MNVINLARLECKDIQEEGADKILFMRNRLRSSTDKDPNIIMLYSKQKSVINEGKVEEKDELSHWATLDPIGNPVMGQFNISE